MPEGKVYVCRWKKLANGSYRGVIKRPKLSVEADSLDDFTQDLWNAIANANGDCEAVIEFEPPIITDERSNWFSDGIVSVGPNSHFQIKNAATIVNDGYCPRCKYPLSSRSKEPVSVESIWPGDASFSWDSKAEGVRILLMSDRLLKQFSAANRKAFTVRPALMSKGSRKKFFEIIPKHVVPEVAIKSLEVSGWFCKTCRHVVSSHGRELGWCVKVISRDYLPKDQVFFVGTSIDYVMCLRSRVWNAMKPILRKASMTSERLAVIEPKQIAKRVKVPEIGLVLRRNAR